LFIASEYGQIELVQWLLLLGANVNHKNKVNIIILYYYTSMKHCIMSVIVMVLFRKERQLCMLLVRGVIVK